MKIIHFIHLDLISPTVENGNNTKPAQKYLAHLSCLFTVLKFLDVPMGF